MSVEASERGPASLLTDATRGLLAVVFAGVPLSIALEVAVQCLPPHYSPVSQTESALALGPYGAVAGTSILIRALATLAFLGAFRRLVPADHRSTAGAVLLAIAAVAKVVLVLAPTDPTPRPETLHGVVHAVAAVASFLLGALGQLLLAIRANRGPHLGPWGGRLLVLAWVSVLLAVVAIATLPFAAAIGVWGLLERSVTALLLAGLVVGGLAIRPIPPIGRHHSSGGSSHACF